jgi:multifunctional methyltransferase subunit TRM112
MVRLITHNILACHAKGCHTNNFPLKFSEVELVTREAEYNPDFLRGFLPKLEYEALVQTAQDLGDTSLPAEQPEMLDEEFLKKLHHVLLEVCVFINFLKCYDGSRSDFRSM